GSVKYTELPNLISYFDVAIIPFLINEHTKGNDLLKLYDYLSLGKPVVSTRIGGAEDLKEVVKLADTPSEFLAQVVMALQANEFNDIEVRKKVAKINSWANRIKEVEFLMRAGLIQRAVSKSIS
ncbi:MAG: hypothetical protein KC643_26360, partial [Nitrospira sp.]|nr:hypothetical protein [Nitrospira sp.]